MIQINPDEYRACAQALELEAAQLPENDPKRAQLLAQAAALRVDVERGATHGIVAMGGTVGAAT